MKKLVLSLAISGLCVSGLVASDAKIIMGQNNCFDCHSIDRPNTAPPFFGIARKNIRYDGKEKAMKNIQNSIINGSSGKYRYSREDMPSFKNLSKEDVEAVTKYIISLDDDSYPPRGKGYKSDRLRDRGYKNRPRSRRYQDRLKDRDYKNRPRGGYGMRQGYRDDFSNRNKKTD